MLDSVRLRLTLWHVGVLAVLQAAFCLAVYLLLTYDVYRSTDAILRHVMRDAVTSLESELDRGGDASIAATSALRILSHTGAAFAIYDPQGRLLADKPSVRGAELAPFPPNPSIVSRGAFPNYTWARGTEREGESEHKSFRRVAAQKVFFPKRGLEYVVVTSQGLDELLIQVEALRRVFAIAVPLVLLLAGSSGWFLARKSLAPVVAMSQRARQIGADNMQERLLVCNPRDELGNLAKTFNELLDRLSHAIFVQRRFMADAAHELRTPISVIRTAASVALDQKHREESEYRDVLAMTNAQARHLSRTVEDVFRLARADSGHNNLQMAPLYLDEVLTEAIRNATILGKAKNIIVEATGMPECPFTGDEDLLCQMVLNLLENSIKYTPAGGRVSLGLERCEGNYVITVSDTGIGIPSEAQKHIFDRFFRSAAIHPQDAHHPAGTGLGLSIAKWVAESHKGTLELRSSSEKGTTFVASLPVEQAKSPTSLSVTGTTGT